MRFKEFIKEDQRIVILRFLFEMPSYSSNSSVLYTALGNYGHQVTRDQIKTELRWLEEQGLVKVEEFGNVFVTHLTERGEDVACGRAFVHGVKRPGA